VSLNTAMATMAATAAELQYYANKTN